MSRPTSDDENRRMRAKDDSGINFKTACDPGPLNSVSLRHSPRALMIRTLIRISIRTLIRTAVSTVL